MTAPIWEALQKRVDYTIDGYWGEPVEFHPWSGGDVSSGGGPDPSRKVLKTTAVFDKLNAGTIALARAMGGGGSSAQLMEQDAWISIQQDNLGKATFVAYDRVYLVDRGEWYAISYPAPSATRRPKFYLIRLQANDIPIISGQTEPSVGDIDSARAPSKGKDPHHGSYGSAKRGS